MYAHGTGFLVFHCLWCVSLSSGICFPCLLFFFFFFYSFETEGGRESVLETLNLIFNKFPQVRVLGLSRRSSFACENTQRKFNCRHPKVVDVIMFIRNGRTLSSARKKCRLITSQCSHFIFSSCFFFSLMFCVSSEHRFHLLFVLFLTFFRKPFQKTVPSSSSCLLLV